MSIRESLSRIPPAVSVAVVCVFIVAVAIYIYAQLGSGTAQPTLVIAEKGAKTTLKCTSCGHTFERETAELQGRYGLPNGRIVLVNEGLKCPKCAQYALDIVESAGP